VHSEERVLYDVLSASTVADQQQGHPQHREAVIAEQARGDVVGGLASIVLRPAQQAGRWCYILGHTCFTPHTASC
jgi:hypothetical protein